MSDSRTARTTRHPLDPAHPVFLLAMDHRDSLAKQVYGVESGIAEGADADRIAHGKALVFAGLLRAIDQGTDAARAGVLVDERYGAQVARRAREAGMQLAMPIEASGHPLFQLEYGDLSSDVWLEHVEEFDPDYVKVLVRDNPSFDAADRDRQAHDLADVTRRLREGDRTFLLELLVPAADGEKSDTYDTDVRPGLTVRVIEYLKSQGVEPHIWKIEGLDRLEDAQRVFAAATAGKEDARVIILGRDAPQEALDRWLTVSSPLASGFAIGRSIWEQPLVDLLAGRIDADAMVETVARNYRHYVDTFEAARN
jgi:myo-inositol catabolism protein IolC